MNIYVCIKQVPDTETKIKIKADNTGIETSSIKWIINPYDEFAIEEALQKKSDLGAQKIIVVSLGPDRVADSIQTALAMGADEGIHILCDQDLDSNVLAQALAQAILQRGDMTYVFTGQLAIDGNNACVGQQVASYLGIPHTSVVSKFDVQGDKVLVEREIESGNKEIIELPQPSLVTTSKGLNTPRFVSLPGIMKAKKKPIKKVTFSDLGMETSSPKVIYKDFSLPKEKPEVKILPPETAPSELVRLLREESKVI